jgi:hypothetical protein
MSGTNHGQLFLSLPMRKAKGRAKVSPSGSSMGTTTKYPSKIAQAAFAPERAYLFLQLASSLGAL